MVVVPADAVVLMPCLTEHPEDLADPASLSDPVALDDHEVADVRSGRILCWRHRSPPSRFRVEPTLHPRASHQRLRPLHRVLARCKRTASTPGGPDSLGGMPTYGYRCPKGHEFEAIHGMGAPPPTTCQVCGA